MRHYFVLFFLLCLWGVSFAQPMAQDTLIIPGNQTVKVDSIRIEGNETTKEFIILREMTFKPGDVVDNETLNYNKERIYSLGIFNFVGIALESESNLNIVVISVKESWYIYPIPFFHLEENTLAKSTYGLNLLYKNFRGRNETIRAVMAFGYDPSFTLEYNNPVILREEEISLKVRAFYSKSGNQSELAEDFIGDSFTYIITGGGVTFGKRFDQFNNIFAGLNFSYIEAPDQATSIFTASKSKIDRVLFLDLMYAFDTRDLNQFPKDGRLFTVNLTHKGFGMQNILYNIVKVDYREYIPVIEDLKFKWRVAHRRTIGEHIPTYDKSYLGSGEYVRGHKGDHREGDNYLIGAMEMSYPVFNEWNFSIKLPLIPRKLTSARIGLHASAFVDTGTVFENEQPYTSFNYSTGYGFGLTLLLLPYNAMRVEYSFNERGQGEFLIESGFSF